MADEHDIGLLEGLATTRAIRRYTDEAVSDEDLAAVMWAATRAPSGSNRQPFRFVVLRDGPAAAEAKGILGRSFRAAWAEKVAADGYRESSGDAEDSPKARMGRSMQRFVDRFEDTPVVVLACLGRHRAAHLSEGASVYPACQNLLLAARARGLGGVMTMWHQPVEAELRVVLGIPRRHRHRRHHPPRPPRRRPRAGAPPTGRRARLRRPLAGRGPVGARPPGTRFASAGPPRGPDRQR